jgi:hypothetical protein
MILEMKTDTWFCVERRKEGRNKDGKKQIMYKYVEIQARSKLQYCCGQFL